MAGRVAANIERLGVVIPSATAPVASYVPYVSTGSLLHISGQLPKNPEGKLITGQLGAGLSIMEGQEAARLCAIHLTSQMQAALGDLDRVKKIVKLTVFVNSASNFTDQPQVANGASDFLIKAFGDQVGRHSRSAVGVAQLPFGVAVEADAIVEVEGFVANL